GPPRRIVFHLIPARWLHRRCRQRSDGRGVACCRPPSFVTPAADLRETNAQAADLRHQEATPRANKSSRFVGIAAHRLSEWPLREVPKILKSLVGAQGLEP